MRLKKHIKRSVWIFVVLFVFLVVSMVKIVGNERFEIASNSYNPRLSMTDEKVKRGSILDRNGVVLAESTWDGSSYVRSYPFGESAAHVTGYIGVGKSGLEAYAGFQLTNVTSEVLQRVKKAISKSEIIADSVVLTIDSRLNEKAYELLDGEKGSVVLMDPSTGEVLALVSSKSFDPFYASSRWESLKNDESSPLLNRAVSGYYPPGSTFKIVTALSAMRNLRGYDNFTYECTGSAVFDNKIIHCYNNTAHGKVNLKDAIKVSCNCYFAEIGNKMGGLDINNTATDIMMNEDIGFTLGTFKSKTNLDFFSSESAVVETAIGQGETLVNPLYMAMLASSIANDGVMMEPILISHKVNYKGGVGGYTLPSKLKEIMTKEEADELEEMMLGVVESGTGMDAKVEGYKVSGKTGTAENPGGSAHSWFIGSIADESGKALYSIAVVIENPEGWVRGAYVAGKLFEFAVNNL